MKKPDKYAEAYIRRAKHDLHAVSYGITQLMYAQENKLQDANPTLYFALAYWAEYAKQCGLNFEQNVREVIAEDQGE